MPAACSPRPTSPSSAPSRSRTLSSTAPSPEDRELKTVGCSIFRTELEEVLGADLEAVWLPAGRRVSEKRPGEAIDQALGAEDGVACLYGAGHPVLGHFPARVAGLLG